MIVPTITIASKNGPVIINESDFDSKKHKLYSEPVKKVAKKPVRKKVTK